jgi:di/tricarboxylate transporter
MPEHILHEYSILISGIIILAGIFLFIRETFTVDTTAIIIMALFIITGILAPEEGFSGFTNNATVTVACMFVLSYGLFKSGILNPLVQILIQAAQYHYLLSLTFVMLIAGFLSAFINDTAVVALLMPVVIQMSERTGVSPGFYLMPLSFAALLGGICTLIGTSTNILVSGIMSKYGLEPLGMFEFSAAGVWITVAGIVYMLVAGIFLLPKDREDKGMTRRKKLPNYIARVKVLKGNKDIGKTIHQAAICKQFKSEIIRINRWNEIIRPPIDKEIVLKEGDELKIIITSDNLIELRKDTTWKILPDLGRHADGEKEKIYKVVVPYGSPLAKAGMYYYKFQQLFDVSILAWRKTEEVLQTENVFNEPMKEGNIFIISTNEDNMYRMASEDQVIQLKEYDSGPKIDIYKAILSVLIMAGVMITAAIGMTKIVISAMVGCLLMIGLKLIKPEEAYKAVDWKVIFLLAGVLSMGTALEKTGGAQLIAQVLQDATGGWAPRAVLAGIFFITFMTTNFLSNNATAALIAPIVINLAQLMQISERPFIIAVMFAASLSFMTPMGYQTNTMIYTPGNYTFKDFFKIGTPLNLVVWAVAVIVIPIYFPF